MTDKTRLTLYQLQLTETTELLEEAREAKSFMAVEKLLKTKQAFEERVSDLQSALQEQDKTKKRSSKEELEELFAIIEKLPKQQVRQIKQVCEEVLGG